MIRGQLRGGKELATRIATIRNNFGAAITVLNSRIGALLVDRIKQRYLKQIDENNSPWAQLARKTVKKKEWMYKRGLLSASPAAFPNSILLESGNLYNSIGIIDKHQTSGLAGSVGSVTRIGVQRGFEHEEGIRKKRVVDPGEYGRFHQYGRGRLPIRRFLGVSQLDIKSIDSLFRREIRKAVVNS